MVAPHAHSEKSEGNIASHSRSLPSLVVHKDALTRASTLSFAELSSLEWRQILAFVKERGRLGGKEEE